ncbi:MAG TPA: hypothetical protein VFF73_19965 [Planctomycetota bacterium]|nr:hypothetical protein [Planctomycetota bacterium]
MNINLPQGAINSIAPAISQDLTNLSPQELQQQQQVPLQQSPSSYPPAPPGMPYIPPPPGFGHGVDGFGG